MSTEIVVALISLVGGFITAWFTLKAQRKRIEIAFGCASMRLLKFDSSAEQSMAVYVNKRLLTGSEEDKDKSERVSSAFGFSFRFKNVGNETANDAVINIELDDKARVLTVRTQPEWSIEYPIEVEKDYDKLNRVKLKIPHTNVGQVLDIALVTTGNEKKKL